MSESTVLGVYRQLINLLVPSVPVVYAGDPEPTAPRPNTADAVPSYAAIEIQDDATYYATASERTTDTAAPDDTYEQLRALPTEGRLAVEFYGPGAVDYARTLRMAHARPDAMLLLDGLGDYVIEQPSQVTREPVLRSATREPDASITFVVRWIESETYEHEAVASIDTTVDVDGEGE